MNIIEFTFSKRITINKGNYESMKLDVSVTLNDFVSVEEAGIVARDLVNLELKRAAEQAGTTDLRRFGV